MGHNNAYLSNKTEIYFADNYFFIEEKKIKTKQIPNY